MRKFSKLALCVVTLVSVVFLVFYKTQYDKLYNVLEVLEFFEGGANKRDPNLCSYSARPWVPPTFQRLSNSIYAYSAFCKPGGPESASKGNTGGDCGQVMVLALVENIVPDEDTRKIRCKLWYEGSIQPSEGIFSSSKVQGINADSLVNAIHVPYHFYCESKFSTKIPFVVTFISDDGKNQALIHVEATSSFSNPLPKSFGICILPQEKLEDSTLTLAESVLLNNFFGVKNFFIYDLSVTHRFLDILDSYQKSQDPELNVRIMPWNPPSQVGPSIVSSIIKTDCYLRTHSTWESIMILHPTQILVPGSNTIADVIANEGLEGHIAVPDLKFCSEFPSADESATNTFSVTALEQVSYDKESSQGSFTLLMHKAGGGKENTMPRDKLAVHDYAACGKLDFNEENIGTEKRLLGLKQEIEKQLGKYFPHKSV